VTPLPDRDPLDDKLSAIIGGKTATALSKGLGLETVGDLLTHYPRRYARLGELTALAELELDTDVTIVAEVLSVEARPMKAKNGTIVEARITDGTGILVLTFFNQKFRANELLPGKRGMFSGKISDYKGKRQLTHPIYEFFDKNSAEDADVTIAKKEVLKPIPIYPATAAMPTWKIAEAVKVVLDGLPKLEDPVPKWIRDEMGVIAYNDAIRRIHQPEKDADHLKAKNALTFQEAFVLQSTLLKNKKEFEKSPATPRRPGPIARGFDESMPFTLTGDQRLVGGEIARDMESTAPMNRLLQGEVGSGKTLVALRAMLAVADSGGQSALLAPTEVLAAQHLRSIVKTLGPDLAAKLRPTLLTGQLSTAERRKALLAIVSGGARIVIGTHALLGDAVSFYDLGLVVVDEQHRFGVEQREALRQKGTTSPHVLVLTATPIPRTVAMTVFGDLEISTISELPSGRTPIQSFVVPYSNGNLFNRVWGRMAEEIARGRQAFVVCPAIDANVAEPADRLEGEPAPDLSEKPATKVAKSAIAKTGTPALPPVAPPLPVMNVVDTTKRLRQRPELATAQIAALHGRMSSEEKDTIMRAFAAGDIDVLVATTVIEVGVDVPNASIMMVLDADRFGVSQLHQLRGRVGRGGVASLAFFATHAVEETIGRERVEAVASTLDGFELAQKDLELRREGDVLGAIQSGGRSSLRLLRVVQHEDIILRARDYARTLVDDDPELAGHPALNLALKRRLDETEAAFLAKN
jgi:ATP-dependent DNA helicase RecG